MKLLNKLTILMLLSSTALTANATTISFSYLFEGSTNGEAGSILQGVIDGDIQGDGNTIFINNFISASLTDSNGIHNYVFSATPGIRGFGEDIGGNANPASMSFNGDILDFWVCPGGFTSSPGDCAFGVDGGGFLITNGPEYVDGQTDPRSFFTERAHAGHADLTNSYRVSDIDYNTANWNASISSVPEPASLSLLLLGVLGLRRRVKKS
ncbi:MAG: hypothetical protein COA96_16455 [SAR86 cluster bacterium]|uniref:Ice-binding protein C-terminal domain-containing protein n=1 Tax=SAR86 cluster bacterium TaxID=2030880 RepID=A0A2A5AJQ0_9GAMM|nr:MAG: hypothetical protein COA96_16455 [SAR86 cluster bacterium]